MTKKDNQPKRTKQPWPTKEAMEQVYEENLWGENGDDFYSGEGSHLPALVDPYIDAVIAFLSSFDPPLTVCDLGCGDFNIGKELVKHSWKYIAVDIVPALIARNKTAFQADNLTFLTLDLAKDPLPTGDCALLRQVLQHLSNNEVQRILNKLSAYNYVILTEHLPEGPLVPNKDIISGQGIRIKQQSGVDVTAPPFNFKVQAKKELVSIPLNDGKGLIVTTLYTV